MLALLLIAAFCARGKETNAFSDSGPEWTPTQFRGEKAWSSKRGAVLAVISEIRGRLLYLGKEDGSLNLLSAPFPCATPNNKDSSPNWGGHRFWLGPQIRWIWPPLTDWEYSGASKAYCDGDTLKLELPRTNTDYPALTREYRWEGSRLRSTVRWKDDGRAYYGMHVVAVEAPVEIVATPRKTEETPRGFVAVRIDGYDTKSFLPNPGLREENGLVRLRSGLGQAFKYAFPQQALRVPRTEGWCLLVHPGPTEGVAVGASDGGLLSQVWFGNSSYAFAEIEQLSPLLLGDEKGQCSSSCFLEAVPPSP